MNKNVGKADAYIRFLIGIALFLNIFALKTGVIGTIVLLVLGLAMIISSLMGYCWLYSLLNIDTYNPKLIEGEPKTKSHH
ncbi:MAG: DUF2892 domain-containing protein [Spirochaetes bacterium]|nr:DUF2892 domain-containing protein [Spirochaetota bacterium]